MYQKNKALIIFIIIWLSLVMIPPIISTVITSYDSEESTGPNDYARITDIDYKAVLQDEPDHGGNLLVTERITFDVHAASKNNLFWELWRDLPEDYVDGLKVDYQVNYVKQINDDGTETEYQESPKLYWNDSDYTSSIYGPGKWYHSEGPYNEDLERYECVFFYVNGLYREEVTFEIQYVMHNAALRYRDVSELYVSMYSEDTIKYLESFKGEILIPDKDMPQKGNYLAHTYGTNSNTFAYQESDTINPGYHTFSFHLDKNDLQFKTYNQYIEFSLLAFNEDRHIFTDYAPANYYSNDVYLEEALDAIDEYDAMPAKAENQKKVLFGISLALSVFFIFYTIYRDRRIKKKHNFYQATTKIQYFRDIPSNLDPYFAATLVFSKQKHKIDMGDCYSALLLNLVRKGYIELQKIDETKNWTTNNILLKILYRPNKATENTLSNTTEPSVITPNISTVTPETERYNINGKQLEPLSINEETYFNFIVRHAIIDSIPMKDFQRQVSTDYDNTDTFVTAIDNSIVNTGVSQGYFQKADYNGLKEKTNSLAVAYIVFAILIMAIGNLIILNTRLDLAYGAFFILGIALIISAILLKKFSHKYILLTQFGEDEYEKWYALYNFLNSATLMKERTVIELPLWEEYLVYATAFGISEKVIKALEIRCPDVSNSPMLSNSYYRSRSFRTSGRSFRSATYRASSISRSARYGGGSYYGGGGRGGGGGGGGH